MSGEFYCIDELGESSNYCEERNTKTNRSDKAALHDDQDAHSTGTSKKSGDCQLIEIEEQLQMAEDRCNTLKSQLDSMKKNYQKISPREILHSRGKNDSNSRNRPQRKRAMLIQPSTCRVGPSYTNDIYEDCTFPPKSNSSLTIPTQPAIYRQNSSAIGTDKTGAAVRTINTILSGITSSVNKLSQLHGQSNDYSPRYNFLDQPFSNDVGGSYTISETPFSPRLNKRLYEQQKKVAEIIKDSQYPEPSDVHIQVDKKSTASVKSKESALERWSKQLKTNSSSKSADGPLKAKNIRPSFNDDQSFKRRKRIVKRLKATSKVSIVHKPSDSDTQSRKCLPKYSSENLVELYHNVAAKSSDSDNSTRGTRAQLDSQQGAGDNVANTLLATYHASKTDASSSFNKSGSRLMQSQRILTPIEENRIVRNTIVRHDYFHHIPRNYELPTIASKLKKNTKSYLRSFNYFNFRCIPFCAAQSTGPSHNIGVNIQQVMGIIKTRQPMSGISPTLAHNLSLAAEKLHGSRSPLSTFVSNLSTRISIGNSTCPLIKHQFNYHKLQEMAKSIPEEPFEEDRCEADFRNSIPNDLDTVMEFDKTQDDVDTLPPVPPIWSASPESTRCTCISQKGVPFQKVLSKYQLASSDTSGQYGQDGKYPTKRKQVRSSYCNNVKQRTAAWVSNGIKENVVANNPAGDTQNKPPEVPPSEQHQLRGKEKNLKTVLKNLHDEFDNLNTKYEELSKSDTNNNPETAKELEEMEHLLNQKEEEINMVMSLYTEVMALKDQVKKLKERTSCETLLSVSNPENKDTNPAKHLTHLLHQIQNYQNRYQSKAQL